MSRVETIGDATLYLGDCREILPTLGKVGAVVTDHPYGIGADEAASKNKGKWGWKYYGETSWDRLRPEREIFDQLRAMSREQIIWGGNYFTDILPPTMRWLIWDKGQRDFSLADFEMAWCSQQKAARILTYARGRALKDGKEHPTQKPIEVVQWCVDFLETSGAVLDPFLGSWTTGVVCAKMGRPFIGIEINEVYFDIACRRIGEAHAEPLLFATPTAQPTQEAFAL